MRLHVSINLRMPAPPRCILAPSFALLVEVLSHSHAVAADSGAPPTNTTPVQELTGLLRRGFFSKVVQECRVLLSTNAQAPVYGLKGMAHAALQEPEQANSAIRRATERGEPDVRFALLNVQALLARANGSLSNAAAACQAAIEADPKHPLAYVTLALIRHGESDFEAAAEQAKMAMGVEPRMSLARTVLGQALQAQGKLREAVQSYQEACILDASDPRPHVGLAEIAALLGGHSEAVGQYRAALACYADLPAARAALAGCLLEAGNLEEAITEAELVLQKDPRNTPANLTLARAYSRRNQFGDAVAVLDKMLNRDAGLIEAAYLRSLCLIPMARFDEARQGLAAAIRRGLQSPKVMIAAGVFEHMTRSYGTASNLMWRAVERGGTNWQARIHFHLANVSLSAKEWDQATNELAQAGSFFPASQLERLDIRQFFQSAPASSPALVNLGVLFFAERLPDFALGTFREAITKNPSNVVALLVMSNLQTRQLKHDEALESLRRLCELAPSYAPGYFAAGEVHVLKGNLVQAIHSYSNAAVLEPNSFRTMMRLGALYKASNDLARSESAYRTAVGLGTNSALACNELANLLVEKKGDLEEALTLATKAVDFGSRNGVFLDTLGWVHFQRQEYAKALDAFQSAVQAPLDPQFMPVIRYHLGLAYHKTGAREKAVEELREVLKLAPGFSDAEQVKTLVKLLEAP